MVMAGARGVAYIVLDDASDTTAAVANARRLVTESKVDVILGSITTPNSLAMLEAVSENQTPMVWRPRPARWRAAEPAVWVLDPSEGSWFWAAGIRWRVETRSGPRHW